jgi:hypothetical protein
VRSGKCLTAHNQRSGLFLFKEGKMDKFFPKSYIVFFISLFVLLCVSQDVFGADWRYCCGLKNSEYYYDKDSVNFLPNSIIRVWVKIIPESEEDRVRHIQDVRNTDPTIPDNWGHSKGLVEINCKDKTFACIKSIDNSTNGKLIKSDTAKNPSHEYIPPETMSEELYKSVCVKKTLKKKKR